MRVLKNYFLGLVLALLAGCAGYHLGPANGAVAGGQSIEILPFNNQTLQPRLGDSLTQLVRERIQTDATFHLATHGPGDVIVSGTITQYGREAINYLSNDTATPENYRIGLTVHVIARDHATGKLLLEKDVRAHTLVHIGADLASAERQAMPLLADDFSRDLVELLAEGSW